MKRVVKMFLTNVTLTSCATPLPYEVCKSDCFWNNVVCSESETTGYCIIGSVGLTLCCLYHCSVLFLAYFYYSMLLLRFLGIQLQSNTIKLKYL